MIRRFIPVPLFLALIACGSKPEAPTTVEAKTGPPVQVRTAVVSQAEWPSVYDAVGTVRARTATQVSARIMGAAREVSVHLGDHVRQGQVLVVIDSGDLEARQRQADAAFAEAQSAELEAQNGIESAKVNLELAQSTYKRMKDLHDKTSISNQEFDEASARLSLAKSGVDMAMSRRKQVESKIAQAKEGQNAVKIQIEYATITAPFAGVVTEKTVEPGNMVTPGAPLLTIEREGAFRLEAAVEEGNLGKVHAGMRASVSLDSLDRTSTQPCPKSSLRWTPHPARLSRKSIFPSIPNLRGGLFGRARFATGSRSVVAVPSTALVERGQMQWVFIADGDTARGRIVTLGQRNQDSIEVLSGLKPGEKIIAPASPELVDGARIEVRP